MNRNGFTLIEMMLGASVMAIVIAALLGAVVGQSFLNASARNLTAAVNDATRVMEELRRRNTGPNCVAGRPTALPPAGSQNWNAWLGTAGQGRSVMGASDDGTVEHLAVTCQNEAGTRHCGPTQVGAEWTRDNGNTELYDPIRVTVSVGWRQHNRVVGGVASGSEFQYTPTATTGQGKSAVTTPAAFVPVDTDQDGVIESQAMLTTLMTCR